MWFWPVFILVLVILFVWWALTRQVEKTETPSHHVEHGHTVSEHSVKTSHEVVNADKEDDLELIEGIGPKISSVLKTAGIKTFAQLAALDADKVRELLTNTDARLGRISDPTTWAEQSRLAAEGKMEDLKALQDNLKGGRSS